MGRGGTCGGQSGRVTVSGAAAIGWDWQEGRGFREQRPKGRRDKALGSGHTRIRIPDRWEELDKKGSWRRAWPRREEVGFLGHTIFCPTALGERQGENRAEVDE